MELGTIFLTLIAKVSYLPYVFNINITKIELLEMNFIFMDFIDE